MRKLIKGITAVLHGIGWLAPVVALTYYIGAIQNIWLMTAMNTVVTILAIMWFLLIVTSTEKVWNYIDKHLDRYAVGYMTEIEEDRLSDRAGKYKSLDTTKVLIKQTDVLERQAEIDKDLIKLRDNLKESRKMSRDYAKEIKELEALKLIKQDIQIDDTKE